MADSEDVESLLVSLKARFIFASLEHGLLGSGVLQWYLHR